MMLRVVSRVRATSRALLVACAVHVTALVLSADGAPALAAAPPEPGLSAKLETLYSAAYERTLRAHESTQRDGTTYVWTGDIPADWLRDTSAIARSYVPDARHDPKVAAMLRGIVARQASYVLIDPYANAFGPDYRVRERKFEMDSLLYPVWFADDYFRATHDASIFSPTVRRAFRRIVAVLRTEQRHAARSHYVSPLLGPGGRTSPVGYTGMVWTAFRPSDDPARYHYNIPDNMFGVVVLRELSSLAKNVLHDRRTAVEAWGLSVEIQRGIEQAGTVSIPGLGRIYAYETDGLGHALVMDDANVPSLLSIPYFGYRSKNDPRYIATRRFVLSSRNPYFFRGRFAQGVGSPHTPRGYVWPLALCIQALTARDPAEVDRVLGYIERAVVDGDRLPESFDVNDPRAFTRADFAWPNAVYAELAASLS